MSQHARHVIYPSPPSQEAVEEIEKAMSVAGSLSSTQAEQRYLQLLESSGQVLPPASPARLKVYTCMPHVTCLLYMCISDTCMCI